MNEEVVHEPRPEFVVQTGTASSRMTEKRGSTMYYEDVIKWEFESAHDDFGNARMHANFLALEHEHVRVIRRSEPS